MRSTFTDRRVEAIAGKPILDVRAKGEFAFPGGAHVVAAGIMVGGGSTSFSFRVLLASDPLNRSASVDLNGNITSPEYTAYNLPGARSGLP